MAMLLPFPAFCGADDVVRQLREMVLLPMQYPGLFESLGLHPPRWPHPAHYDDCLSLLAVPEHLPALPPPACCC